MQRTQARFRSGSRAEARTADTGAGPASDWEREWQEADAVERRELEHGRTRHVGWTLAVLVTGGALAAALPSLFPLTPGFSASDTMAVVTAAIVIALVAVGLIPLGAQLLRGLPHAGAGDPLVLTVALLSAGAAAIHFAVAKMHFDEYTLFGVFFVGSGLAQLVWALWLVARRWRPLLVLGALGNAAIVALWAVDRLWGLPLGPEHWKPEPVAFADSAASAFEVLVFGGCIALLVRGHRSGRARASALVVALAVMVVTALSLLSVLGVGSSFLTPAQ